MKKICVVGLGYIGLPTASLLGTKGYQVLGVDVAEEVVKKINAGQIHIKEPDLDIMVRSAVQSGQLSASLKPVESDVFIIAVPTPFGEGMSPNLEYVKEATKSIIPYLKPGNLVILESTSPVGTTDNIVAKQIADAGLDIANDIYIAHCPERVLPGRILLELVENDRIVGGINEQSTQEAANFYREFVRGEVLETSAKTAELAKLTENSFRDVNIAFANELSMICNTHAIDVWELIELANRHPRVNILRPGPGVGGHCIAVDPWFIVHADPDKAKLIRTAREVNDSKPIEVIRQVEVKADKFKRAKIACLGLAFKPDIDDLRESPALQIVNALAEKDIADIIAVEPNLKSHDTFELWDLNEAIEVADIVLVLVSHRQFAKIPGSVLKEKILIDTCGCINA